MRIFIFLLLFQSTEPLSDRVLIQEHQHRRSDVAPMTLAAIEAAALENNREIRVMKERVVLAKAGITPAIAVDDPSFTLRDQDELRLHNAQVALARQAVASARIKYTVGRVPQQDVLKSYESVASNVVRVGFISVFDRRPRRLFMRTHQYGVS